MDTDTAAVEGSDYESAALPDEVKDVYEGDNAIDQAVEALQTNARHNRDNVRELKTRTRATRTSPRWFGRTRQKPTSP